MVTISRKLSQYLGGIVPTVEDSGWTLWLFGAIAVLLIGFAIGRTRLLLALVSVYAAVLVEKYFPYFTNLKELAGNYPDYQLHLGLFIIFYLVIFFVLNRSLLKQRLTLREANIFWVLVLGLLWLGLLISVITTYLPVEVLAELPVPVITYFSTKIALFSWAILPLLIAVFLKRED